MLGHVLNMTCKINSLISTLTDDVQTQKVFIIWEIYTSDWALCVIFIINLFLISAYVSVLFWTESSCNYFRCVISQKSRDLILLLDRNTVVFKIPCPGLDVKNH
jgi:hypothetical protein